MHKPRYSFQVVDTFDVTNYGNFSVTSIGLDLYES